MKKEKVNLTDEEKMKKSFRIYGNIAEIAENVLIVVALLTLILFIGIGISIFIGNNEKEVTESTSEVVSSSGVEENQMQPTSSKWSLELLDDEKFDEFTEMPIFVQVLKIISIIAEYIFTILIIHNLKKMFKEIAQDAKPFTENNIKRLNIISWLIFGLWVATNQSVGIMFVISIFALNKVFKYGYKLQIESDETL